MTESTPPTFEGRLSAADVATIASRQKILLVLLLVYLVIVGSQFVVPESMQIIVLIPWLLTILAATAFVFLLATKLYGTAIGVILGILTFVPCIGILVILVVNGKATRTLRDHGVEVGFLGAK